MIIICFYQGVLRTSSSWTHRPRLIIIKLLTLDCQGHSKWMCGRGGISHSIKQTDNLNCPCQGDTQRSRPTDAANETVHAMASRSCPVVHRLIYILMS
jgi:hypothetical protein